METKIRGVYNYGNRSDKNNFNEWINSMFDCKVNGIKHIKGQIRFFSQSGTSTLYSNDKLYDGYIQKTDMGNNTLFCKIEFRIYSHCDFIPIFPILKLKN